MTEGSSSSVPDVVADPVVTASEPVPEQASGAAETVQGTNTNSDVTAPDTAPEPDTAAPNNDANVGTEASASAPAPVPVQPALVEPTEIPADPDFSDEDSALGDSASDFSSTMSVSASIFEYRKLHGRTFPNFGNAEYWAPNDDKQNDGLDIAHHMMYLAHDNRLYLAPLENPQRVLDVGTGTGIWAIDFADEFPSAEVIGTDISPIQPAWMPPNCRFELDNASENWTYADESFDYIHLRCMMGCFKDWVHVYRECFRCLKPGGWIEHLDFSVHIQADDGSVPEDAIWTEWRALLIEAGEKMGQTFEVVDRDRFVGWMNEAGFPDVKLFKNKIPLGPWAADKKWKEVGSFNKLSSEQGLEGYMLYILVNVIGWEYERVQVWLSNVRKAMARRDWHAYYPCITAYAQKPLA